MDIKWDCGNAKWDGVCPDPDPDPDPMSPVHKPNMLENRNLDTSPAPSMSQMTLLSSIPHMIWLSIMCVFRKRNNMFQCTARSKDMAQSPWQTTTTTYSSASNSTPPYFHKYGNGLP